MIGLAVDLTLLAHDEDLNQYIPFVVIGLSLTALAWHLLRPGRASRRAVQGAMIVTIITGWWASYCTIGRTWSFSSTRPVAGRAQSDVKGSGGESAASARARQHVAARSDRAGRGAPRFGASRDPLSLEVEMFGRFSPGLVLVTLCLLVGASVASAQVAKGLVDPNVATEAELTRAPAPDARDCEGARSPQRPFASAVELDKFLDGPEADAGAARGALPQGLHSHQPEHRHGAGDPADSRRRQADGARVRGIPALEKLRAVRQGDRQVRRPRTKSSG